MKLNRATSDFVKAKITQNLADNTVDQYCETLRQLEGHLDDVDVEDITSDMIEGFIGHLQGEGMSSGTVGVRYTNLVTFFKWLKVHGVVARNPIREGDEVFVEHPKVRYKPRTAVTEDHYNLMIGECQELREKVLLGLMFRCGFRVGELGGILRKDIRESDSDLYIKVHGKGDRYREVPLVHIFAQEQRWVHKYLEGFRSGPLFPDLTQPKVYHLVQRTSKSAGIDTHYHPHAFRHGCAVGLLLHGVDSRVVQQILGHESIATTEIYTHMTPENTAKVLMDKYRVDNGGK